MKLKISPTAIAAVIVPAALAAAVMSGVRAQAPGPRQTLKEEAVARFEEADYAGAIAYLKQALEESTGDADIYYYLGYFTHYLCYDSVPLTGFDRAKSDEILGYLRQAVALDPEHGNARYFIGAEYGARARDEMQHGDTEGAVEEFRSGRQAGGYPDWMIEFGRNVLRPCERDAILFVGGDAETNPIQYLQWVEKYRTDVTVIPWGVLERPSFVALLKRGVPGFVAPAPISWSGEQIASMRPFKWKKNTISIPVPENVRRAHGSEETNVEWEISPDLGRGDTLGLLSGARAVLVDIVLTNRWGRPIYFSTACSPRAWEGLEAHMQLCGIAHRLLPSTTPSNVDAAATSALLLDERNFQFLPRLRDSDMPRASGMLQNYRVCFLRLIHHHHRENEIDRAKAAFSAMKSLVPEDVLPIAEQIRSNIEALEETLQEG
jgi:tetratricopeptide (TPR) repeat protein